MDQEQQPDIIIKTLKHYALGYQTRGMSVIPVGKDKKPLIPWKNYQNIRAAPEEIEDWWTRWPEANIGIVTGSISGITVMDIDPKNGGTVPPGAGLTLVARTQSGGWHYYYKFEPTLRTGAGIIRGVDIRNNGGYVVAPPSKGEKGDYSWSVKEDIADFPVGIIPETARNTKLTKDQWKQIAQGASEGERNGYATKYIGKLLSMFESDEWESLVWSPALDWNKKNTPPLEEKELRNIFEVLANKENAKPPRHAAEHIPERPKLTSNVFLSKSVADITPRPIEWLWEGKIAKGKVTLIAGHPGLGKSQVSCYIAAKVSTGEAWVMTKEPRIPKKVIMLSAEDGPEDTIVPRLMAAGCEAKNIHILEAVKTEDGGVRGFDLSQDITNLRLFFRTIGDVGCIIIDPISAYMGEADSHKNAEVRALLSQLTDVANEFGVAVIAITHMNKSGVTNAQMGVMGSLAFVATARSAFMVLKDEDDEDRRKFVPMKNNLAKDTGGLAYTVVGCEFENKVGQIIKTSKIRWENVEIRETADSLLKAEKKIGRPDDDLAEAKEFLVELLQNNTQGISSIEAVAVAKKAGISRMTLYRAKGELDIKGVGNGFGNPRLWKLDTF